MQSGGWWPGAHPGLVALFLLRGTLHVTTQAGGADGVGTCGTVVDGSVLCPVLSVIGAVNRGLSVRGLWRFQVKLVGGVGSPAGFVLGSRDGLVAWEGR